MDSQLKPSNLQASSSSEIPSEISASEAESFRSTIAEIRSLVAQVKQQVAEQSEELARSDKTGKTKPETIALAHRVEALIQTLPPWLQKGILADSKTTPRREDATLTRSAPNQDGR